MVLIIIGESMKQQLVYDLPTRIFHWAFAGLFLTAFIIAKTIDDDSPIYAYHMLVGLTLGFSILLRIVWGFFGTQHAKFSDFAFHPKDLLSYFKGILTGDKKRWAGHNPASSWAAVAMMVMALGLALSGYLMTSGPNKETFEDLHELLGNGLIITVILHVTGIIIHTVRHKDMIGLSMIHGQKTDVPSAEIIFNSRPTIAIFFVTLVISFGLLLFKNYDSQSRKLQLFGSVLQLGENEDSSKVEVDQGE
jgi:cytochrome b